MFYQKKKWYRIVASVLVFIITLALIPPIENRAAEEATQGEWSVVNDNVDGTDYGIGTNNDCVGFKYYSYGTKLTYGVNKGVNYVRSSSSNGKASDGIVITDSTQKLSYCEYPATADGTMYVNVGNAGSKTGYVSGKKADGTEFAIGSFVPGLERESDVAPGFKVSQNTVEGVMATVEYEVEASNTYYITLTGSKMFCYGAKFVPYTPVKGSVNNTFGISNYSLKFVNEESGAEKIVSVTDNKYDTTLKPGNYTVALIYETDGYTISVASRSIKVETT
ncbi:MAG: hypothetical protein K6F17_07485, partial [Lachnospiraceae bacterium]|nr:hypothetical protein [Lachnospiraceae bacterium]